MTTPTIEIEATANLETALEIAIADLVAAGSGMAANELKMVLADVVRARCIKRRFDEQQISLRLPPP